MSAGPAPDRFLVGLAVLGLLSEAAEGAAAAVPDRRRAVARSGLGAGPRVCRAPAGGGIGRPGVRRPGPERDLAGLPELVVGGLREADARALLDSVLTGPLDARVRDQIVAETRGNPLALLEVPRGLTPAELAGGFGLPGSLPRGIEESFRRRIEALPAETRRLLLVAAAEPSGDAALVWRAAAPRDRRGRGYTCGRGRSGRVRHPGAVSSSAGALGRLPVGVAEDTAAAPALAEVTDPRLDPDRRAWHRAHAAAGPDEDVAAELEARPAGRRPAAGWPPPRRSWNGPRC